MAKRAPKPTAPSRVTAVLPRLIESVEIRSRFSPPYSLKTEDLLADALPGAPPSPLVGALRPTIVLRGPLIGEQVIAPAGQASPTEWRRNAAVLGVAAAAGVFAILSAFFGGGVLVGRRR